MNEHILTLARENAPCYLYEYDIMKAQVETLRQTFPQYDLLYSIKANPFPPVVRALAASAPRPSAASAGSQKVAHIRSVSNIRPSISKITPLIIMDWFPS